MPEEVYQQTPELERYYQQSGVGLYRRWQDEAREDYDFVEGRQWTKAELMRFRETMRPAITINRIRPLLNLLSGYRRSVS